MLSKSNWTPLNHRLLRDLKSAELSRVGIAVSGGRDSVLLLHLVSEIRQALDLQIHVLHVHHGDLLENPVQSDFRDRSAEFTQQLAAELNFPFHSVRSPEGLKTEDGQRDFRRQFFAKIAQEQNLDAVFLGHHGLDLLETRLQRLIRGTGGQGLQGMLQASEVYRRPLLHIEVSELEHEAQIRELRFVQDPSNVDSQYFRNWLRNDWLPQLEAKAPGSVRRMAESLEILVQEIRSSREQFPPEELFISSHVLAHPVYQQLSSADQLRTLALLIRGIRASDYSKGQLLEIQKRLDNSQNEHTFRVAGLVFQVTPEHIRAHPSL